MKSQETLLGNGGNERRNFANWLVGFTDGEGCFFMRITKYDRRGSIRPECSARFSIELRADDGAILQQIKEFFGCGLVRTRPKRRGVREINPQSSFSVSRTCDLFNCIVPFFETNKLRAKKSRDFEIWKEGIEILHMVSLRLRKGRTGRKWAAEDFDKFESLCNELESIRKYDGPQPVPVVKKNNKKKTDGFFQL